MTPETPESPVSPKTPSRRPRFLALVALALVSLFAMGAAFAGGPGKHRMHKMFTEDPDAAAAFVAARLANEADATADQEEAIRAIIADTITELAPMRAEKEAFRAEVKEALLADVVDPAALETLRVEGIARADEASKVVTEALGDIAAELSPEQRQTLADELERMRERFHGPAH